MNARSCIICLKQLLLKKFDITGRTLVRLEEGDRRIKEGGGAAILKFMWADGWIPLWEISIG